MSDDNEIVGNKSIVKIEVSPFSDDQAPTYNVFSYDGLIDSDIPVDDELLAKMEGETIKFFYYRKNGTAIELLNEAGKQNW